MKQDITDENKSIAEFMGCYGSTHWVGGKEVYRYGFKNTHITERWHESEFSEQTPYHSSWDWLMPVWKKIGHIMFEKRLQVDKEEYQQANIITVHILKAFQQVDIETAFSYIVEAIQWYNKNAQPTTINTEL